MKLKILLTLFLTVLFSYCFGQRDFRSGYVIISKGDTILGKIDYRGDTRMSRICDFQTETGEIRSFTPYDILGYRFTNGKYYVSRKIDENMVFMEYLIKGILDVYYLRDEKGDRYFIQKETEPLTELTYKEEYIVKSGKDYLSKSVKHYGILNYYTQDAPKFEDKIKKIKKPQHKNLISLAESYHNVVCDDENCVIYEKRLPPVKVNFEVTGGIINYNYPRLKNRVFPEFGIIASFWLPLANENFYFKTGFLCSSLNYDIVRGNVTVAKNVNVNELKIPLRFEYIYPVKYKVRPRASIGGNIYFPHYKPININYNSSIYEINKRSVLPWQYFTFTLSGGFNVRLSKSIDIMLLYDADFSSNDIKPFSFLLNSQNLLTGLYFKF